MRKLKDLSCNRLWRQNEIDTPGRDRTHRHVWMRRCIKFLCNGESTNMESVLCTPVLLKRRIIAVIGMRYVRRALSNAEIIEKFMPLLANTARKISLEIISRKMIVKENEIQLGR